MRIGVALLVGLIAFAACANPNPSPPTSAPTRAIGPTSPPSTPTPAAPSSPGCANGSGASAAATRAIPTLRSLLQDSSEILVGTMTGTGPAAWDTPGGREPTPEDAEQYPGVAHPVHVEIERMLRGEAEDAAKVLESGGQIGCGAVASLSVSIYMFPGERSVFFLGRLSGFRNAAFFGARGVWEVWPIDGDGLVQAYGMKPLTVDDLAARIAAAPGPSPSP